MAGDGGANWSPASGGPSAGAGGSAPRRAIVRRAPLVCVAAAMVAGIVAGRYVALPIGAWAALGVAGLLVAGATLRREHLGAVTAGGIAVAVACGGAVACSLAFHTVRRDHVVTFSAERPIMATLRGQIASTPRIRTAARPWQEPNTTFLLDAAALARTDGRWASVRGLVRVRIGEAADDLTVGSDVELVGTLTRPRRPGNPGQTDWALKGRYQGVLVTFAVPGADGATIRRAAGAGPLTRLWHRLRRLARRHLDGIGSHDETVLLEALVLGERDPALRNLNRAMVDAGVAHFLSISGLHLGIFLGFVYGLCRLVALPPRRSAGTVLVVLAAYALLAEPRAPLLRASLMAGAVCIAVISGRSITTSNALAAAAIVLLLADPLQVFGAGFQLSFAIVAGLLALHRPIKRLLFGRFLRRRGLRVYRRERRVARWVHHTVADGAMSLVAMSVAAYVSAAPLVACHFGLFTPYAPGLSILLLPVVTATLIPAYVSLMLSPLLPNLAAAVGALAAAAAGVMQQVIALLAHLPGLSIDLFVVPAWAVVVCYVALGLWAAAGTFRLGVAAAGLATVLALGGVALTQRPATAPPNGRLHVLDVGHGAMVLFHAPDGRTVLFDAGTLGPVNAYDQVLRPFLRAKRLRHPEAVFISHANLDHYSAIPDLLDRRPPRIVYLSEYFGRRDRPAPAIQRLMRQFQAKGVKVARLWAGTVIRLPGRTRVEVLWPPRRDGGGDLDFNDASLVCRLSAGRRSVLLTGDIGTDVERTLAQAPPERMRSDVLVLPHHGSATPTLEAFIDAVGAKVLIQSSVRRRETPGVLAATAGRRHYATFHDGWIGLDLAADPIVAETLPRP